MAITIRHGVNNPSLEGLAGQSVGEIRRRVKDLLNMSGSEEARLNGVPVDDEDTVNDGCALEFVKVAGEKGVTA